MKRALITGGAGFAGSHLKGASSQKGVEVRVLDSLKWVHGNRPEYLSPDAELVCEDIRSPELMHRIAVKHGNYLIDALLLAHQNVESLTARAFKKKGGTSNTISLIEQIGRI